VGTINEAPVYRRMIVETTKRRNPGTPILETDAHKQKIQPDHPIDGSLDFLFLIKVKKESTCTIFGRPTVV